MQEKKLKFLYTLYFLNSTKEEEMNASTSGNFKEKWVAKANELGASIWNFK